MLAASERPEGEPGSFLWTKLSSVSYMLSSLYREKWPGKVAVVVGGSVDMHNIRASLKKEFRAMGVELINYHRQLLTEEHAPQCNFLLLVTEALFNRDLSDLRNSLDIVFDTCECHRIRQTVVNGYGWCDSLTTLLITQDMMRQRSANQRPRYIACKRLNALPMCNGWEMDGEEKYQRVPNDFLGFPLPDVFPRSQKIFELIDRCTPLESLGTLADRDWKDDSLSFNSMPLAHLLAKSLEPNMTSRHKLALILVVSAVQLTTSSAFALLFQSQRDLLISRKEKWKLAESACILRMFLSLGGSTSVEVGIVVLCMQDMLFGIRVEDADVGEGPGFSRLNDFMRDETMQFVFKELLTRVISLTKVFSQFILEQLQDWEWVPDDAEFPSVADARRGPGDLDVRNLVSFLEGAMCQATEPSVGEPDEPQKFDFAINPEEGVLGFRCQDSPFEHGQGTVLRMHHYDEEMMGEVFGYYGCQPNHVRCGCATFDLPRQGDYFWLLSCLDIYQHLAEHDLKVAAEREDIYPKPRHDPLLCNIWFGEYQDPEWDPDGESSEGGSLERGPERFEERALTMRFSTRPLWLLNPDTNPSGEILWRRVHALKRSVIPGTMFLAATLLGEPENTPATTPVADISDAGDSEAASPPW